MQVKGLNEVLSNLNKSIDKIEGTTLQGLLAAGLYIEGESNEITPVEFGVLVNSSYTKQIGLLSVAVGYTAEYAAYVHEMASDSNWTKQGTGNKFLEKAVKNNTSQILKIIQARAKV